VSPYNPRDVKTVERAWKQDYKDNMGLHVFKKRVELCSTQDRVYARVLPVVQSSGTGKSRLLDEVAKTTFTFPLCLRPPEDNGMHCSVLGTLSRCAFFRVSGGRRRRL
jgi:hypothetical protein